MVIADLLYKLLSGSLFRIISGVFRYHYINLDASYLLIIMNERFCTENCMPTFLTELTLIIIIIMVIFKCYFSGELIALS